MKIRNFLNRLAAKFVADDTTTLAASLAFYTALSLAPLVILFVSISSKLGSNLQQALINQVGDLAGFPAAKAVAAVIYGANEEPHLTSVAGVMGLCTLLFSASLIFGQLRGTLNKILQSHTVKKSAVGVFSLLVRWLRGLLIHIGLAVGFILTMILSLLVSTIFLSGLKGHTPLAAGLNWVLSAIFYVVLFSSLFHFLPDQRLRWSRALRGGALTAVMFVFGKELIGLYLSRASFSSAYGAAGSIIVFLVWVYYSALITFIGAQVSSLLGNNAPPRARGRS